MLNMVVGLQWEQEKEVWDKEKIMNAMAAQDVQQPEYRNDAVPPPPLTPPPAGAAAAPVAAGALGTAWGSCKAYNDRLKPCSLCFPMSLHASCDCTLLHALQLLLGCTEIGPGTWQRLVASCGPACFQGVVLQTPQWAAQQLSAMAALSRLLHLPRCQQLSRCVPCPHPRSRCHCLLTARAGAGPAAAACSACSLAQPPLASLFPAAQSWQGLAEAVGCRSAADPRRRRCTPQTALQWQRPCWPRTTQRLLAGRSACLSKSRA